MKRILCYGDSNTWGYDPVTGDRFDAHTRWTRILAKALGAGYEIIEEGLNGRTTVWDDPIEGDKNGKTYLMPCLATHRPLDLVILMLGTNDLKHRFSLTAFDIAEGAKVLGQTIQTSACTSGRTAPPLLLMAPAPLATLTDLDEMFLGGEKKSLRFAQHFSHVAKELGCHFLNAGEVVQSSPIDGIHLESGEHAKLGQAVAIKVREILG